MKKILTAGMILAVSVIVFAQSYQDAVYLKNGRIIRGKIIEQIAGKQLKIETADRAFFIFQADEIEKVYKRTYSRQERSDSINDSGSKKAEVEQPTTEAIKVQKQSDSINSSGLKKGYQGITAMGCAIGVGAYKFNFINLNIINSYRVNPHFSLGLGTGFLTYLNSVVVVKRSESPPYQYLDGGANIRDTGGQHLSTAMSVFADVRVNFINKKVTPYFSIDIGYSFISVPEKPVYSGVYSGYSGPSNPDALKWHLDKGGYYLSPAVGISFKISRKNFLNISIGCEMQRMTVIVMKRFNYWGGSAIGSATTFFNKDSLETFKCIGINSSISF